MIKILRALKIIGTKARVLKGRKKPIREEQKQKIIQELVKEGKIEPGQSIEYDYFLKIYEPYIDEINEQEFARILGIKYDGFMRMKNSRNKSKSIKRK